MLQISADEDMINQVIYNLVDNAVKFTRPAASLKPPRIPTRRTPLCVSATVATVFLRRNRKIFERFYKVDKSRSFDTRGAGLGFV
jgi:signal transduction histidine kinase